MAGRLRSCGLVTGDKGWRMRYAYPPYKYSGEYPAGKRYAGLR